MMRAGESARIALPSRSVTIVLASLITLTAALVATSVGRASAAAPEPLTVSAPDTVGFPYVDLIVGGVPGLGLGAAPSVRISQDGSVLRTTDSWELSPDNPLAVIVDSPAASLARAQGLAAELVQEMPPNVPMSFVSVSGASGGPWLNRDDVLARLAHQKARTASTVKAGLTAANSLGIQHVVVITTCADPAPSSAPAGLIVDVLGIGPTCSAAWTALPAAGMGTFAAAADFDTGLGAMDAMVARWRSSVVAVTQVLSNEPLTIAVGSQSVTATLPGGSSTAVPPAASSSSAPASSRTDHTALIVGLVLLVLAGLLLVVWWRHRRPVRPEPVGRPEIARPATWPSDFQRDEAAVPAVGRRAVPMPRVAVPQPAREPAAEPAREPRQPVLIDLRDSDGPDVRDESVRAPQMAVATQQLNGEAGASQSAVVARLQTAEEPVVVAEETPDETQATEIAEDQAAEATEATDATEVTDAADATEVTDAAEVVDLTEPAEDVATEPAGAGDVAAEADGATDAVAEPDAGATEEQPAAETPFAVRSEFQWTKLEFTPLVWRYDAEPEAIDLREAAGAQEPGTVDVRDQAPRKQTRRRKARR